MSAYRFFTSCVIAAAGFAVIAYYGARGKAPDAATAEKLTHIMYSFLHLKGNSLEGPRDSAGVAGLVSLKRGNPGLKVLFSIGGWGGCAGCSAVVATPGGREEFAQSALDLLRRFHADGIDIDWEYPAIEGYPGHRFDAGDRHNFTLLLKGLRQTLGDGYEISFAAGGFTSCLLASYEWESVMPLVDRVNVMTYDLVNGNSAVTGHLAPLYSVPGERESADNAVRLLDSIGVPPGKIVIGAAFYARVWGGVRDSNTGLFQSGRFTRYVKYRDIGEFFRQNGEFRTYWDSAARASYSFSPSTGVFATYDDTRSVGLKTEYALRRNLGGIMFWELGGDLPSGGLLDAIDSVRRGKR